MKYSFCGILTDFVLALHRQQQRQLLWLGAYKHIGAVRFALWIQLAILLLRQAAVHVYATQQGAGRVMRGELYIIICKDRRIRIKRNLRPDDQTVYHYRARDRIAPGEQCPPHAAPWRSRQSTDVHDARCTRRVPRACKEIVAY